MRKPKGDAVVVAKQSTSIEELAEAIEDVCVSMTARTLNSTNGSRELAEDARARLRTALQAFVAPHLRLIEGGGRQEYEESIPAEDRVTCPACKRDRICSDVNCPHWHKAIRDTVNNEPDDVA